MVATLICIMSLFFVKIFTSGGTVPDAMDEFLQPDLVADVDEATDRFGASEASELEGDADPLKGFRLRWSKKRRVEEDDIVPSPSLVGSEVLAQNQQQVSEPPLSAATEMDHTTSVTNAFLTGMKPSTIVLPSGAIMVGANFWRSSCSTIIEYASKLECAALGSHC